MTITSTKLLPSKRPSWVTLGIMGLLTVLFVLFVPLKISCPPDIARPDRKSKDELNSDDFNLKNAIEKIKARNAYLCTNNTDVSEWKLGGTPAFHKLPASSGGVISLLSPVYTCPWTLHRTNYVSTYNFDGGKWTCGLVDMLRERSQEGRNKRCIVYSFGSNNDDFFERDVRNVNPDCEIHIFDPTSGTPPPEWEGRYHFHPSGLCVGKSTSFTIRFKKNTKKRTFPCKSLQGHMLELGHTHVDILKADVEGMEWDLTKQWEDVRIGQVMLEFHFWYKNPRLINLLRDHIIPMERAGYFMHMMEPVSADFTAVEIAFLNVNWSPEGVNRSIFNVGMYPSTPGVISPWD